jgi:urease accessory protein
VLADQKHVGPLLVQRPFYPEGEGTCHVYMLHPPGGVVGGDRLRIEAALGAGAEVLLTTPAAGKFYRSAGPEAEQVHVLRVAGGGCLEWLPQETIVYSAARAAVRTEVHLDPGARFIGWEIVCLGRPAAGESFREGWYRSSLEVWRAGRRLVTERARFEGAGELLSAPWGLARYPVTATLVAVGDEREGIDAAAVEAIRNAGGADEADALFGVTRLDGVWIARYLGFHGEAARSRLTLAWTALRQALLGKAAAIPRIWYT